RVCVEGELRIEQSLCPRRAPTKGLWSTTLAGSTAGAARAAPAFRVKRRWAGYGESGLSCNRLRKCSRTGCCRLQRELDRANLVLRHLPRSPAQTGGSAHSDHVDGPAGERVKRVTGERSSHRDQQTRALCVEHPFAQL